MYNESVTIVLLALLTYFSSAVGTLSGFGLSTIMIPFVVLIFPLQTTLLFVGLIHGANDIWKMILFRKGINWKILLAFGIPGIAASYIGAKIAVSTGEQVLTQILGIVIIIYSAFLIFKPTFKLPQKITTAGAGGLFSGLMAGIFGIGGAIRSMALSAFDLKKEVYLFTSGAIALFIDVPRLATYLSNGIQLNSLLTFGLLFFIPASFLGAKTGKGLVNKIPQENFRKVIAIFLLLVGLKLIISP